MSTHHSAMDSNRRVNCHKVTSQNTNDQTDLSDVILLIFSACQTSSKSCSRAVFVEALAWLADCGHGIGLADQQVNCGRFYGSLDTTDI